VLANGFFVATEFSTVAVRRSRIEQLFQEGHPGAANARDVVGHLDAYIAATQLGITLSSLALGWIGEPALAHLLEPGMAILVGPLAPAAAHGVAIAVAFAIITMLHIVLGELAPKGLALQYPEGTILWVARPIKLFYALFRWPVIVLNGIGNGTLRLFGLRPASGHEMVHSVEELRLLVTGMQQAGVVEASEARIAARAFSFADLTAGGLMTPRTEVDALPVSASREDLEAYADGGRHARVPVYEGSLDNVVGVLHQRDLFRALRPGDGTIDVRALLRPPLFVPEGKHADDLLEEMRVARRQFAVVVDEFGGTAGIVTLEDLLGALVGGIEREPESAEAERAAAAPAVEPDGSRVLDGLTRLDELEELLGVRLGEADHQHAETLGGLVMARLRRVPDVGDEVSVAGRTLRVEARDGHRVAAVRLLPLPEEGGPAPGPPGA
jgi:putative hemolysin